MCSTFLLLGVKSVQLPQSSTPLHPLINLVFKVIHSTEKDPTPLSSPQPHQLPVPLAWIEQVHPSPPASLLRLLPAAAVGFEGCKQM